MVFLQAAAKSAVQTAELGTQTCEVEEDAMDKEKNAELHSKLEKSEEALKEVLEKSEEALANVNCKLEMSDKTLAEVNSKLEMSDKTLAEVKSKLEISDKALAEVKSKLEISDKTLAEVNCKLETSEETLQELRKNVLKLLRLFGTDNAVHVDDISKIDDVVASITSADDDSSIDTDDET